ncbi:MAG: hypothetical protein ACXIVF_07850 [Rhizobiaceae bacterium]
MTKTLLKQVAGCAVALMALMLMAASSATASEVTYRVVGVASNDVLNVRDRAGVSGSRIVGVLAPGTSGVVWDGQQHTSPDGGLWWRILHPNVPQGGWVNSRFLAEMAPAPVQATEPPGSQFKDHTAHERPYRVVGVASNDVLNIRSGPGTSHRIVGTAAPGSGDIWITGRIDTLPSGAVWVELSDSRLPGGVGWVNGRFLQPQ